MRSTLAIMMVFKNSSKKPAKSTFLCEYQSGERLEWPVFRSAIIDHQTHLMVAFDGGTQRRFSSVRIVLYCSSRMKCNDTRVCPPVHSESRYTLIYTPSRTQRIKQLGPVTHRLRGYASHPLANNSTRLPRLTVAFEVIPCASGCASHWHRDFVFRSSGYKLPVRTWTGKRIRTLLESKHSISPDTSSLSLVFEHRLILGTVSKSLACHHDHSMYSIFPKQYMRTRTVRVVPTNDTRSRTSILSLPPELLLKIFEATDSCKWQYDLLSYAQVCRQWSCAMKVFCDRWESSKWKDHCLYHRASSLDLFVLARVLNETPALGLGVQHLHLNYHDHSSDCRNHKVENVNTSPRFTEAAMTILRATKSLRCLRLSPGFTPQGNVFFATLPKLHDLRTLAITQTFHGYLILPTTKDSEYIVSMVQLMCCMARWPSLTSLTIEYLEPGQISLMDRFFFKLWPPACALTELCIRKTRISGRDLLFLTASSTCTLAQVTLESI